MWPVSVFLHQKIYRFEPPKYLWSMNIFFAVIDGQESKRFEELTMSLTTATVRHSTIQIITSEFNRTSTKIIISRQLQSQVSVIDLERIDLDRYTQCHFRISSPGITRPERPFRREFNPNDFFFVKFRKNVKFFQCISHKAQMKNELNVPSKII